MINRALARLCVLAVASMAVYQISIGAQTQPGSDQAHLIAEVGMRGVYSVAFSPDGRFVITGSADNTARIWDVAKNRQIRTINVGTAVKAVAYSPDGQSVVTPNKLGGVTLWNPATGARLRDFRIVQSKIYAVAFSRDGQFLISSEGSAQKQFTIELWEVASGKNIREFHDGIPYPFGAVAFSPDGRLILSGSDYAKLWNADSGQLVHVFTKPGKDYQQRFAEKGGEENQALANQRGGVNAVAFSPDGKNILTGGGTSKTATFAAGMHVDNVVRMWDVSTGDLIRVFNLHQDYVTSVGFSADGRFVLTASGDHSAFLWDAATGQKVRSLLGHKSVVSCAIFSPMNRTVLTSSFDGTARLWDVDSGANLGEFKGRSPVTYSVAFSPNGRFFITGSGDGDNRAYLWDTVTGRVVRSFRGHTGWVESVAVSPDNRLVLTGSLDGTARVWDLATGKLLRTLKGDGGGLLSVKFSPDGTRVATAGYDAIRIWNVTTGAQVQVLDTRDTAEVLSSPSKSISFSPDGKLLVAGYETAGVGGGATLRIWDISSGKTNVLMSYDQTINSASFSPDGKYILTGDQSAGQSQLWSVLNGKLLGGFRGYKGLRASSQVTSVEYSKDGKLAVTADSPMIRLWNVSDGKLLREFTGHTDLVTSARLSPDGMHILTASWDDTIRLWDIASGKQAALLLNYGGEGWVVSDDGGRFDTNHLEDGSALSWIADDDPSRLLGVEVFMRQYYTPRLLADVLGHNPMPQLPGIAGLNRVQPAVTVTAARENDRSSGFADIELMVGDEQSEVQKDGAKHPLHSGVYDLRLFRDGQMVGEWPPVAPDVVEKGGPILTEEDREAWRKAHEVKLDGSGKAIIQFHGVRLPERTGMTKVEFTAYAFNRDRVKSLTTPAYEYTLPSRPKPPAPRRAYLIAMGVNANQSHNLDLDLAVSSAERARTLLREKLHADYPDVAEIELYSNHDADNQVRQPTARKADLKAVLDLLAGRPVDPAVREEVDPKHQLRSATPDDAVVLYVASHGYADPQGTFYLMPYDTGYNWGINEEILNRCVTRSGQSTSCNHAQDLLAHSVSSSELGSWWSGVDAGQMVMILDSCHSGAVPGKDFRPGPLGDPGFGQLSYDKGMQILSASQPAQTERGEWVSGGEGRTLLVDALETVAAGNPQQTLQQWMQQIEQQLPITAKQLYPNIKDDNIQTPLLLNFAKRDGVVH